MLCDFFIGESTDLDGRINFGLGVVQDLLESPEQRRLEEHGRHFAVPGDAVQHFGQAVVG